MTEFTELELRSDPAEAALLGALAFHAESMSHVLAEVPPDAFYKPAREAVWSAARKLSASNSPIDPVAIARQLHSDGQYNNAVERLISTEMSSPYSVDLASRYAETVVDLAHKRKLLRACQKAIDIVGTHPGQWSEALSAVKAQFDGFSTDKDEPSTLNWSQLVDEFEVTHAPGGSRPPIPSPWWQLDQLIGGFFGSRVYVIGGRPGTGKARRP